MSAIDHLKASDTLQLGPISYTLQVPFTNDANVNVPGFCVAKQAGSLDFTLTSSQLNLLIPNLEFPFKQVSESGSIVTWDIHKDFNPEVPYTPPGGPLVHIKGVHGQIAASVGQLEPAMLGTACDGVQPRLFESALSTVGNNTLIVEIDAFAGPAGDYTASAKNIAFQATGGEILAPLYFDVRISPNTLGRDNCFGTFIPLGTTVVFTALVENLVSPTPVTNTRYTWTVPPGAQVLGNTSSQSLTLTFNTPGSVKVAVQVTVTAGPASGTFQSVFGTAVLTAKELGLRNFLCHFWQLTRFLRPPIPEPGDPFMVRDPASIITRPYLLYELDQIRAVATRIAGRATELSKIAEQVIKEREGIGGGLR
jgi:hypothetical protein